MTDAKTLIPAEAKPFLGAQIDAKIRDSLFEDAKNTGILIRLMSKTLHADEIELRRILLGLGPDGLEAAKLAANFMTCREKLLDIADLMKAAAGRVFLTLEEMEADGEIITTQAIEEPLKRVLDGIEADAA